MQRNKEINLTLKTLLPQKVHSFQALVSAEFRDEEATPMLAVNNLEWQDGADMAYTAFAVIPYVETFKTIFIFP